MKEKITVTKSETQKNCMGIELSTSQNKKTAIDKFIKENDIDVVKEKLKKTEKKLGRLYKHPEDSPEYLEKIEKLHIVKKKLEKAIQEDCWVFDVLKLLFGIGGMIGFFIAGFVLTICFLIHGHGFLALLTIIVGIVWYIASQCAESDEAVNIAYISAPILTFLSTCIIYSMVGGVGLAAIPIVFLCGIGTIIGALPIIAAMFVGMKILG